MTQKLTRTPLNTRAATALLVALSAEHEALKHFVDLLGREQGMLMENLADQLIALSVQKTSDAVNLDQLAETRRALLIQHIPPPHSAAITPDTRTANLLDAATIKSWLEVHSPEGLLYWHKIIALADSAQQLNRTNGELIMMKLRRNHQALAVLCNAANKANLYGSDGQHSFSPGSGRSLGKG